MKINKCNKLVCNLYDKNNYVVHIGLLKYALKHGLKLKEVHRVIQFNQGAWLKEYIDMNTDLRKKAKNNFEKDFFKLMNNAVFGKTSENIRKHRDINLVTAFEKQTKTIEDQEEKQIKAIQDKRPIELIKKFTYGIKDSPIV